MKWVFLGIKSVVVYIHRCVYSQNGRPIIRGVVLMTCGTSLTRKAVQENGSSENMARWLRPKDTCNRSCGAEINGLACMMEELPGLVDPTK